MSDHFEVKAKIIDGTLCLDAKTAGQYVRYCADVSMNKKQYDMARELYRIAAELSCPIIEENDK